MARGNCCFLGVAPEEDGVAPSGGLGLSAWPRMVCDRSPPGGLGLSTWPTMVCDNSPPPSPRPCFRPGNSDTESSLPDTEADQKEKEVSHNRPACKIISRTADSSSELHSGYELDVTHDHDISERLRRIFGNATEMAATMAKKST